MYVSNPLPSFDRRRCICYIFGLCGTGQGLSNPGDGNKIISRFLLVSFLALMSLPLSSHATLPKRLVLALDGVSYRDMKALQEGVTYKNRWGRQFHRQAFQQGYFPVSRMISTFPSSSDTAWTEILGDRPLPGYQRTYFSAAANTEIFQNGISTTMEYEQQMNWQETGGMRRSLGYGFPRHTFNNEVREMLKSFLNATNQCDTFYAYLRSSDDAQHVSADILAMLCTLDEKLQELRSTCHAREGRDLEIVILSDHGNNHAGPARRIEIQSFLKKAGYRIAKSIRNPKDIVLPTGRNRVLGGNPQCARRDGKTCAAPDGFERRGLIDSPGP